MKGELLGRGLAHQQDCPAIPFTLVMPTPTPENVAIIARSLAKWQVRANRYPALGNADLARRARFAVDVLRTVQLDVAIGVCCTVIAIDPDDDILGAAVYLTIPSATLRTASLFLLAIDPAHLPGSPTTAMLRGVGTSLVAAIALRLASQGVETFFVHPIDDAAARFWRGRGLVDCGQGGLTLCVRGQAAIRALVDGCQVGEDSVAGEVVLCGRRDR